MNANVIVLARTIGSRIRERRTSLGLTQSQLAAMAGISERSLRFIEMGTAYGVGLENLVAVLTPLDLRLELADGNAEAASINTGVTQGSEYSDALARAIDAMSGGE